MSYSDIPGTLEKINFFLSELGYDPGSVDVHIVRANEQHMKKFDTQDYTVDAFTYSYLPDHYIIYVREQPKQELVQILSHECIHIDQIQRGDLKISADYRTVEWKGTVWDCKSDYERRPWEWEASTRQGKLVRAWNRKQRK